MSSKTSEVKWNANDKDKLNANDRHGQCVGTIQHVKILLTFWLQLGEHSDTTIDIA